MGLLIDNQTTDDMKKEASKFKLPKMNVKSAGEYAGKAINKLGSAGLKGLSLKQNIEGIGQSFEKAQTEDGIEKAQAVTDVATKGGGMLAQGAKLSGKILEKAGKKGASKVASKVGAKVGKAVGSKAVGVVTSGLAAAKGMKDIVSGDATGGFVTETEGASNVLGTAGATLSAGAALTGAGGTVAAGAAAGGAALAGGASGLGALAAGAAALGPIGWAGLAIGGAGMALGLFGNKRLR